MAGALRRRRGFRAARRNKGAYEANGDLKLFQIALFGLIQPSNRLTMLRKLKGFSRFSIVSSALFNLNRLAVFQPASGGNELAEEIS